MAGLIEHLHAQARVALGERARLLGEVGRRADVGGQVGEVALHVLAAAATAAPCLRPRSRRSTLRTGPASTFFSAGGGGFLPVFRSLTR